MRRRYGFRKVRIEYTLEILDSVCEPRVNVVRGVLNYLFIDTRHRRTVR